MTASRAAERQFPPTPLHPLQFGPCVRTDNPTAGADHVRLEGAEEHSVVPAINRQHRLMMVQLAHRHERPHTQFAHVAERHRWAGRG
jgi:hypothetical protein